jgi:tetratricopeptide (TPR) repeat protein
MLLVTPRQSAQHFTSLYFLPFQAQFQKAEAHYCMGQFEKALVYYHRGHKLRPELHEFRLGIQKAQEAIINSVGSK